ncbi:MAG: hypothetical protein P3B98_03720, partial [Gemmatimonadota bacterium]|nr:hypothetical protein [Gemmatimonadota bacterium]
RADSLRVAILAGARFVQLDSAQCQPGALRTFPDSARPTGATPPGELMARLERLIIAQGVENPVDTPLGHALLRGVAGWEAGMARPNWDVPEGTPTVPSIAAGLAGEFWNPDTKKCESFVPQDAQYVLLPPLKNFTMPRPPKTELTVGFGAQGLLELRDKFFAAHRKDSTAVLTYAHVIATVIWRDYAVVAVNRPAEQMGAMALRKGAGGSTYLFHLVNGEWRLLGIVRTWA